MPLCNTVVLMMCDDCIYQSPKIYDSLIANIWLPPLEKGFCRQPLRLTQEGADPWIEKGTRDLTKQGVARTVFRRVNKGRGQWEAVAASSSDDACSQRLMCYVCGEFKLPQATCGRPRNGPLYSSGLVVSDTAFTFGWCDVWAAWCKYCTFAHAHTGFLWLVSK